MNYKDAEKLAQKLSLENPDDYFYVNYIEDDEYFVDKVPEYEGQSYYLSGVYYYEGYENDYDF